MRRDPWHPSHAGWRRREVPELHAVVYEETGQHDGQPAPEPSSRPTRGASSLASATLLVASGSVLVTFLLAVLLEVFRAALGGAAGPS